MNILGIVLTVISREKFHIVIIISHNTYIKKPMTVTVHDVYALCI